MPRLVILVATLLMSACDFNPEHALDRLSGRKVNLVILAKQPVLLTPEVKSFSSQEQMKVIGGMTSICFALRGGISLQSSKVMDQAFEASMQKAKIQVVIVLSNGDRVTLRQPLQAWSMYGKIIKNDELSACASTPCKSELPPGSQVTRIEVSSDPPLQVQGVYWESERAPLEKPVPSAATAAAAATKGKSSCAAA